MVNHHRITNMMRTLRKHQVRRPRVMSIGITQRKHLQPHLFLVI